METQEIIYFEIRNRVVHMFCRGDRQEEFYLTMDKLEKSLKDKNFVRVHRSYLVNLMHIHSIEVKQIICMNDICIPVGENVSGTDSKRVFKIYIRTDLKEQKTACGEELYMCRLTEARYNVRRHFLFGKMFL